MRRREKYSLSLTRFRLKTKKKKKILKATTKKMIMMRKMLVGVLFTFL